MVIVSSHLLIEGSQSEFIDQFSIAVSEYIFKSKCTGSILVSAINPFSKDVGHLKSQEAFLVVRKIYQRKKHLSIRCVTEGEKGFLLNPFFLQKCEDTEEIGMQTSANDLMVSQAEQQKHYLRIAFECTCHSCPHFDTKTLNIWSPLLTAIWILYVHCCSSLLNKKKTLDKRH